VGDMATLRLRSVAISFDPINKGIEVSRATTIVRFRFNIEEA
jgi:hypothetical protein